jgi:hypothetical protein
MASRFTTLALLTLAALVHLAAGASSARGQGVGGVPYPQRQARLRFDLLDVSESAALQSAAIEDSDENSLSRYRADETRHCHDLRENTSHSYRPAAHPSRQVDTTAGPALIYRFCKLLI